VTCEEAKMNKLYEKIAEAIRKSTIANRFNTVEVVDKEDLMDILCDHFSHIDCIFIPEKFRKACNEVPE